MQITLSVTSRCRRREVRRFVLGHVAGPGSMDKETQPLDKCRVCRPVSLLLELLWLPICQHRAHNNRDTPLRAECASEATTLQTSWNWYLRACRMT